ncbi:penicillin-binding protein 1C [Sulfitobacter sp. LCG007]
MRRWTIPACVALMMAGAALRDGFDDWVDATVLPPVLAETSVEVHDRNGALLRVFPVEDGRTRLALGLGEVDPRLVDMLIAYEDKRFWTHSGADPVALIRAAAQAIARGQVVSGGSTLTMQVARLLENSGTGRLAGKLRQIRVALALERKLGKERILELYLLHAPYGGALEGLRAGSRAWFGKEPHRLDAAEAALLVALPQSPESRRPDRFPAEARAATLRVLARTGQVEAAGQVTLPERMLPLPGLAPHLTWRARVEEPFLPRHDLTLDADLQARIETLARLAVRDQPRGVSAAILVADHVTGEILASVGAPEYSAAGGSQGFVDMTRAARSPGSTLKPFVYGIAFERGLAHPDTLIDDSPVAFGSYAPQNFDGRFRGEVTVREALQQSLNIPPVLLLDAYGPERLLATLRKGGAMPLLPGNDAPGLAVALGGVGLTLSDLVQLYAALPQGGAAPGLTWRMQAFRQPQGRMLSPVAAWQVSQILARMAPPAGTGTRSGGIAFKTGTSYGHRDAWAVGFDGRHVVGVWLGRPDGTSVPGAFGGDLAAPVLFEAFGRIAPRRVPLPPPPPETLIASNAELPLPLRHFGIRRASLRPDPDRPVLAFPPDGAELSLDGAGLTLKVRAGTLPMTVLVNGRPAASGVMRRETTLDAPGPGFSRISVIDAAGRSDQVDIRLK